MSEGKLRDTRNRRAVAIASMLRDGWSAREIRAGLKTLDASGDVEQALKAMRHARVGTRAKGGS